MNETARKWLTLIGTPLTGVAGLTPDARAAVEAAEIIVAPKRLLGDELPTTAERHAWPSPLADMFPRLEQWRGRSVVILATGDPFTYGIGATLSKRFASREMHTIPAPSAFSLAAARLCWPVQDITKISLHGRPVSLLAGFLQPQARILALTANADSVRQAAQIMEKRGFGSSKLTILQNMGAPDESVVCCLASKAESLAFADFNTLAIECVADAGAVLLPRVPGLPDDAFVHDGQLTKREVRAATLAALGPVPGGLLWDVGAGCGSVSIEWMRASLNAAAVAFELNDARLSMIAENAQALGVPGLEIISGKVPETLLDQPAPDAVFIGGAVSEQSVFDTCWEALKPGGRLVGNAVTLEGQSALSQHFQQKGGDLVRMDVSHVDVVGGLHVMRPRMAVLQYRVTK